MVSHCQRGGNLSARKIIAPANPVAQRDRLDYNTIKPAQKYEQRLCPWKLPESDAA
jgi:hypothetical protein